MLEQKLVLAALIRGLPYVVIIGADAPGDQAQHMAGKVRHLYLGRHKEAGVLADGV